LQTDVRKRNRDEKITAGFAKERQRLVGLMQAIKFRTTAISK
jgi:hypothetical protein